MESTKNIMQKKKCEKEKKRCEQTPQKLKNVEMNINVMVDERKKKSEP